MRLSAKITVLVSLLISGSAVLAQVSVSISPTSVTLAPNSTKQFSATVTGSSTNPWVKWAVDGVIGGNTSSGTISTSGLYTAPSTTGSHMVTAISNADPTKSASASVTVSSPTQISVTISPTSATLAPSATKQFSATVTGSPTNPWVHWAVDGVTGGSTSSGTISTSGLYTSPATTGSHTVSAISNADPTKSASAAVTVSASSGVSVTIIPTSATVAVNTIRQFSDTVSGTSNTAVTWSVDGINGGNTTAGTVDSTGLYTAPASTGSHVLTVTSAADPNKSASAQVSVVASTAAIYVITTPQTACLATQATQQYQATVYNTSNQGVTWAVDSITGGNSTVGTITSAGLYTAPAVAGSHSIRATSIASTNKSSSAQVSVNSAVKVWISPGSTAVAANSTAQFSANVCAASTSAVTWFVDGVAGGNATAGTIDNTGRYTAPASAGSHTVKIVSTADTSKSAQVPVSVFTSINVDFGARTAANYPIPAGVIGAQLGSLQDSAALSTLSQAGLTSMRFYARIQDVFSTGLTTPNWTLIDPTVSKLQAAGLKPLVELSFTPGWLQPSPNPCTNQGVSGIYSPPADVNTWAQIAAAYVAHFDTAFPGFVQDYEIWNEPDLPSFCVANNSPTTRLNTYLSLYAAAGAAMRARQQADGSTIRIGGPALSNPVGLASTWLPALLSNTSTAQYVDFVSYHLYLGGSPQVQMGMTWDVPGITAPLYTLTQSPTTGPAGVYELVAGLVKNQPNAAATPIYWDEYDDNSAFAQDCCRSDPNYGPVWNALVFSGLLNSVYSGAPKVPTKTAYYAASSPPYFCLLGTIDANMDCSTSVLQPYPQFYAFKLVASPAYLGLQSSGFLAPSVYPPIPQVGLAVSAFYTSSADSILIVNPTASSYSQLTVFAQNAGFSSAQATSYLLNSSNPQITSQSLALTPSGTGFTMSVSVPPYSVIGIKIQ